MILKSFLSSFFLCLVCVSYGQEPITGSIAFQIKNFGVNTVDGSFSTMNGTITFSPDSPESGFFSVCADASTVDTQNEKRDKHLKEEDFFHVEKYPEICITSSSISATTDGFIAGAALDMHGVAQQIEIPFTYDNGTLSGSFEINRRDFGVGPKGGFSVGKTVKINIQVEL